MEESKILIVPDVHGRSFWREPVMKALKEGRGEVIFLGDYTDPYQDENVEIKADLKAEAFAVLEEIIDLKEQYPDRITLLLGNHDLGYAISTEICFCRTDITRYNDIRALFRNNIELFQLACRRKVGEKDFVFSHAGIFLGPLASWGYDCVKEDAVEIINSAFSETMKMEKPDEGKFSGYLNTVSYYRGGFDSCGSLIWADVREFGKDPYTHCDIGFQIFGHTRSKDPIRGDNFAMLDCRKVFYLDEKGRLLADDGLEVRENV